MLTKRAGNERGHTEIGWLDSYHSFSFDRYHDPRFMNFRSLRVLNEDWVSPGAGFPTHPHRDMEIITYVLEGSLHHSDSMGNGSPIRPGEVQRMSAGTGVTHSEFNGSKQDGVHLLQIWLMPERTGLEPGYEQKNFSGKLKEQGWTLVGSRDAREDSVRIHQDVDLYAARLRADETAGHRFDGGRHGWLQVARGVVEAGQRFVAGDAAMISQEREITVQAEEEAEALLFDLA